MKQVYLFAIVSVLLGWTIGELARPLEARKLAEMTVAELLPHKPVKGVKSLSDNTIEVAANLRDQTADKDLPPEVIDARTKGQAAREKAIKEAIGKVFPKEDDWGVGGPLFPMEFAGKPRPRPTFASAAPLPPPIPGFAPPGPWMHPGDPGNPFNYGHYSGVGTPTTPVPEPATWAFMIAGFAALALRLRSRRAGLAR